MSCYLAVMDPLVEKRLDKQATAIRALREQVARLESQVTALLGASPSTVSPADPADWSPPTTCAMCGEVKKPDRHKHLTCAPCAADRQVILVTKGADRTPLIRTSCATCTATFGPATRFLCPACSTAFQIYKATH